MVKKSLFIGGITLSLIVTWMVISEESQEKFEISSKGVPDRNTEKQKNVVIIYDTVEKSSETEENNETEKIYVPEKYVETHAFDMQRKYEIALVNPNQKKDVLSSKYIKLYGMIGTSSFEMMVPEHIIHENHTVMLRIKNLETGVEDSTEATFLYELNNHNKMHTININPDAIYNFNYENKSVVLP